MVSTFAIVVPVGSYHPFLERCLKSLTAQRARLQVALIDASEDSRVKALADQFDHLLTFRHHGPDNGQADAIVRGWQMLDGEYLGWLNADDALFPDALEIVANAIRLENMPDVVYGHSTILNKHKETSGYQWGVEPPSNSLGHAAIISQPSCFLKRTMVHSIDNLNTNLHYTMDWDLFLRAYEAGASFKFIDSALSQILWSPNTKTSSFFGRRQKEITQLQQRYDKQRHPIRTLAGTAAQNLIDRSEGWSKQFWINLLIGTRRTIHGIAPNGWSIRKRCLSPSLSLRPNKHD